MLLTWGEFKFAFIYSEKLRKKHKKFHWAISEFFIKKTANFYGPNETSFSVLMDKTMHVSNKIKRLNRLLDYKLFGSPHGASENEA